VRVEVHRNATPAARGRSGKQRRIVCARHAVHSMADASLAA
jgi:hypothetical protein